VSGSGVVVDPRQGLIFTNSPVIDHADEIIVTLPDGRELPANRVGFDRATDVTVIKLQAKNLTALPIGDSDALEVGDFVLAIGNPYQIGQTVTSGMIGGLQGGMQELKNTRIPSRPMPPSTQEIRGERSSTSTGS
jgi:S1-C subfamily serine protease